MTSREPLAFKARRLLLPGLTVAATVALACILVEERLDIRRTKEDLEVSGGRLPKPEEREDETKRAERAEKFMADEYKSLWDYYKRTLDERHTMVEYYFKVVAAPAGLISGVLALPFGRDASHWPEVSRVLSSILIILFIAGFVVYTTYLKESNNSKRYERALASIRRFVRIRFPEMAEYIVIDSERSRHGNLNTGSITWWRANLVVVLNSGVGVLGLSTIVSPFRVRYIILSFIALALIHLAWGRLLSPRAPSGRHS